jgi:adenylosuccinate synthase
VSVTVIVGGQFGSEGKGKVAHYFAREKGATVAIRVGGSNSGHTVIDASGESQIFRMLPTAAVLTGVTCVLGAGSYIDVDVLLREIEIACLPADRLWIDPNAYILRMAHKEEERRKSLGKRIGSTQSGTGAAVAERVRRLSARYLAADDERLRRFVKPVRSFVRSRLRRGERVIIEGTQGFGLSVLHSRDYPHVTSRDTTAGAFVAEAGVSPLDVDDVVLVIRAFPIRVAGDSGPLPNEIDWETVGREGGWMRSLVEYTSVTKKVRRVARFDAAVVRQAIETNRPTTIVLNHLDHVDMGCLRVQGATQKVEEFTQAVEAAMDRCVDYIGLGPSSVMFRSKATSFERLRR